MAMNHIFATLACCLLAVSFAKAQRESGNVTLMPTTTPVLNTTTFVTSSNSTANATAVSNMMENTTSFTSTTWDNKTFNETTSHTQTSQSTTIVTPLSNGTSLITTPGTDTPGFTALTTPAIQTTTGYNSTTNTTVITTAYSSQTDNTTSDSEEKTTQALGLNISEKNMTIVFSVILGLFAVALVSLMFRRCKHKFQYLHQPLNNTDDTDLFVADDDTLVISGGLYDGHPIHNNVPTAPADQSQFRLEFLH